MYTVLAALMTAVAALLGYWLTYRNNIHLAQRAERLQRVNRQLGEFYGPMLAISSIGQRIFHDYRRSLMSREHSEPPDTADPEFRAWMKSVFMPNNERLYDLILTKADLLVDDQMPECLLQLSAHVAAFRAIMHRWEENDYEVEIPPVPFPKDLFNYARDRFYLLRREQRNLMKALGQAPEELPTTAVEYIEPPSGR